MLTTLHQQLLLKQQQQGGRSYLFPLGAPTSVSSAADADADAAADAAASNDQPRQQWRQQQHARPPPPPPLLSPEYQTLLQELIAALLGYFGDVFVDTGAAAAAAAAALATGRAADDAGVLVSLPRDLSGGPPSLGPALWACPTSAAASDPVALARPPWEAARAARVAAGAAPWLAPRDRAVLERLAALGAHCSALRAFVARERAADDAGEEETKLEEEEEGAMDEGGGSGGGGAPGRRNGRGDDSSSSGSARSAYRRALASGVAEVMSVYEATVTGDAQRRAVLPPERGGEGAGGGLPALQHALADAAVLLPQLHAFVWGQVDGFGAAAAAGAGGAGGRPPGDGEGAGVGAEDDVAPPPPSSPPPPPHRAPPLRGAALLHALHRRAHCGHPLLEACFQRLYWHAQQALLAQLAAWMAHGELLEGGGDGGGEFFVQPSAAAETEEAAAASSRLGPDDDDARRPPTREEEETASYRDWHESVLAVGGGGGGADEGEGGGGGAGNGDGNGDGDGPSSSSSFDLLPPGVTSEMAASAAFVGRAVRLLRSAPAARMARQRQEARAAQRRRSGRSDGNGDDLEAGEDEDGDGDGDGDDEQGADSADPQLLPARATDAYAAAVTSVADRSSPAGGGLLPLPPPCSSSDNGGGSGGGGGGGGLGGAGALVFGLSSTSQAAALGRAVELARADAARRLWRVLARDADVLGHLRAVRAYALLGRGDLFSAFLEDFFARAATFPVGAATAAAAARRGAAGPDDRGGGGGGGGGSAPLPVPAALEGEMRRAWLSAAARCGAAADPHFALFWPRLVHPGGIGGGAGGGAGGVGGGGGGDPAAAASGLFAAEALAGPRAAEAARRVAAGLHPPPLSSPAGDDGLLGATAARGPAAQPSSAAPAPPPPPPSRSADAQRRWGDALCVAFRPPWPLGLLLTPAHLARYSAVGRALLRLRRVQAALDGAWADLGRLSAEAARARAARRLDAWRGNGGGGGGADEGPAADGPLGRQVRALAALARLRQHMAHLVGNLGVYLQTDVVDGRFAEMLARVAAAADFAEAQAAHDACARELVTQSLLPHSSLSRQFGEVFSQALRLAEIVSPAAVAAAAAGAAGGGGAGGGAGGGSLSWVDEAAVRAVSDAFQATTAGLYVALQSRTLQQHDRAPHLRQLQLRLDFNGYIGRRRLALLAGAKEARAAAAAHQQAAAAATAARSGGGGGVFV